MFPNLRAAPVDVAQYAYHASFVFSFAVRSCDGPEEEKDGFIFLLQCPSALGLLQRLPALQNRDRPVSVQRAQSVGVAPHCVTLDSYLFFFITSRSVNMTSCCVLMKICMRKALIHGVDSCLF